MPAFRSLLASMFAALMAISAFAQETPEAAYEQLHNATLAGKIDEALKFVTAASRADLAAKPQAEREGLFRAMAQAMPRTYTVNDKTIEGGIAKLSATGIMNSQGNRFEVYLSATLSREGSDWKVAGWGWSNKKPAPAAPKPETPPPEPATAERAPQESKIVRRTPGTDPNAPATPAPAVTAKRAAAPAAAKAGSARPGLDARSCLDLPTDAAIRACAEKYR